MKLTFNTPLLGRAAPLADGGEIQAILGPTNTGKTHYAIERMLTHRSGMIGLPLRLLAREVFERVVARAGSASVALVTGEERINPGDPRYWVCTIEAMPRAVRPDFLAIDEAQLAADRERGHIFTDRLINYRGRLETLFLGSMTVEPVIRALQPDASVVFRPRLSTLSHTGYRKLSRLPRRSAIVAFSAQDVYEIAEFIRRRHGGAAVVLGALSPRTRNAQVALYQAGDVDYLVATDAIGMGLNLDIEHVAFASDHKFDGRALRRLSPAEFGQIAGRAGRNRQDGAFGSTGRCPPLEPDLVEAVESHQFAPLALAQWRNDELDFSSIDALRDSLLRFPGRRGLARSLEGDDVRALEVLAADPSVRRAAKTPADVSRLWDACQIPDYRNVSSGAHADLVKSVFGFVVRKGHIAEDWMLRQLSSADRVDGDIPALSARVDQVRVCAYLANRPDWLVEPGHWQVMARQVEDRLSDALHERLAQRFIDRRTSLLMRRHREKAMLNAEVTPGGDVQVEGETIGRLQGFRFTPVGDAGGEAARIATAAAASAITGEADMRAARLSEAVDSSLVLANDGAIRWLGDPVAKLIAGEAPLRPRALILADEIVSVAAKEIAQRRIDLWLAAHVKRLLGPLLDFESDASLEGAARGLAFQIVEAFGVLERSRVAPQVKGLDQNARGALRKLGVRFGAYTLYFPALLKPAPRALAAQLWALKSSEAQAGERLDELPQLAASGRTSFVADKNLPREMLRVAGFRLCGERAVRVDILERLTDLIRPAVAYHPGTSQGVAPPGAAEADGFVVTVAMTSLAGCSGEAFASILRSIGFESRMVKAPVVSASAPDPAADATAPPDDGAVAVLAGPPSDDEAQPSEGAEQTAIAEEGPASEAPSAPLPAASESPIAEAHALPAEAGVVAETPAQQSSDQEALAGDEAAASAASATQTAEAPAVPVEIQIWRPVRHHRPRDFQKRGSGAGEAAQGDAGKREERRRFPPRRPNPAPSGELPAPAKRNREDSRRDQRPARSENGERHRAGAKSRTEGEAAAAPPRRREQPVDLNSPFAKLLALKSQLEAKGRDR